MRGKERKVEEREREREIGLREKEVLGKVRGNEGEQGRKKGRKSRVPHSMS